MGVTQNKHFDALLSQYLDATPGSRASRTWAIKCREYYTRMSAAPNGRVVLPKPLADWASRQRFTKLSDLQEQCLAAIPGWSWDPRRDQWERQRARVEAFMREHGRAPRAEGTLPAEPKIGLWLKRCRNLERNQMLPQPRREKLDELPLPWR